MRDMWIMVLHVKGYHIWMENSLCVYVIHTTHPKTYLAGHNSKGKPQFKHLFNWGGGKATNKPWIDLTLLLIGANPGSIVRTVSGELIKRFMRAVGAMQFGCCFTRFQLGALSLRPYVGKHTREGELHVQQGALLNVGPWVVVWANFKWPFEIHFHIFHSILENWFW